MNDRLSEIESRLKAHQTERKASSTDELGIHWRDIAWLLVEVRGLQQAVNELDAECHTHLTAAREAEQLALSLAEALSDAVPVLEHAGRTHFDAVWRLIKAQAALSSPALLKLKGVV